MRDIPQEVQKLVALVYLTKNNKEKKQKLKKKTEKKNTIRSLVRRKTI